MHDIFDKEFKMIEMLCDLNPPPETSYEYRIPIDQKIFKKVVNVRNLLPMTLGQRRKQICEQEIHEADYAKDGEKMREDHFKKQEADSGKGLLRVCGYKHYRALKMFSQLTRCLKDCYEQRF